MGESSQMINCFFLLPHPLHQLHPQRCVVDLRMLDNLDNTSDFWIPLLVLLAVRFHLAKSLLEGLARCRCVSVLKIFIMTQDDARLCRGLEIQVRPLEISFPFEKTTSIHHFFKMFGRQDKKNNIKIN